MNRLRHPIRAIREPFGTAGLVVACVALIAALGGTALAAAKLNSTQKKEVEKIAKKYAGKPGAPGAQGPAGPQGPAGANGKDGTNGTNGTNGESVTLSAATGCGAAAGTKLTVGSSSEEVCNGKEGDEGEPGEPGEPGPEGSPWTDKGVLPSGATETGVWAFSRSVETITTEVEGNKEEVVVGDSEPIRVPISFPIPLTEITNIPAENVHWSEEPNFADFDEAGDGTIGCEGTTAIPKAPSGHLCVYLNGSENPLVNVSFVGISKPSAFGFSKGASPAGAVLEFSAPTGEALGRGSYAYTG